MPSDTHRRGLRPKHAFIGLQRAAARGGKLDGLSIDVRRSRQRVVFAHVLEPSLDRRGDHGKTVAAAHEHLWRIRHPGEFDDFPHNGKIAQVTIELKNHKQSVGHKDVTVKAVSDGDLSAGSRTNRRQPRGVGFA